MHVSASTRAVRSEDGRSSSDGRSGGSGVDGADGGDDDGEPVETTTAREGTAAWVDGADEFWSRGGSAAGHEKLKEI